MDAETKRPILGKLRDQLKDFLMKNHPFVREVPLGIGKESVNTFEEDLLSVFAQSEEFVMSNTTISALITQILEVIGLDVSTEVAVEYAARRMSTKGELPKENPVLVGLLYDYAVLPVVRIQQLMTRNLVMAHPELHPHERAILHRGVEIARLFDTVFSKWWQYVVVPYQLGIAQDPTLKEAVKEGPLKSWYAVLVDERSWPIVDPMTRELLAKCQEIPLAEAFPLEIGAICEQLDDLNLELEQWSVETVTPYHDYFDALSNALLNRALEKAEELWKAVDVAWVQIGPEKVVPVHMMENGYHHPHQISPEFRVLLRSQAFQKEIGITRKGMDLFGAEIGDELVGTKLNRIDIGMFITAIAGGCIDFRIAGQSVPNRPEVQELGMKIFLDLETMRQRHIKFVNLVESCADAETLAWVSKSMDLGLHVSAVASHEFAHPFLITKRVTKAFGRENPNFEEGKATLFGIMGLKAVGDELNPSFYPALSSYILGELLKRFDKRAAQDPTLRPYLNEAMMIASSLMDEGIITCVDGKVHADKERCSTAAIVEALEDVSERLVEAYKDADTELELVAGETHPGLDLALDIVSEYASGIHEDSGLSELFAVVNQNLYGE